MGWIEFSATLPGVQKIEKFAVAGASKRGFVPPELNRLPSDCQFFSPSLFFCLFVCLLLLKQKSFSSINRWTTWTVAAVDKRVIAMIPIVMGMHIHLLIFLVRPLLHIHLWNCEKRDRDRDSFGLNFSMRKESWLGCYLEFVLFNRKFNMKLNERMNMFLLMFQYG